MKDLNQRNEESKKTERSDSETPVKWRPGVFYWTWSAGLILVGSGAAVLNYPTYGVGGVLVSFGATALGMCASSAFAYMAASGGL